MTASLAGRGGRLLEAAPPVGLVLGAVVSVQVGAAFARTRFDEVGPAGTAWLRLAFSALVLVAICRPRVHRYSGAELRVAGTFGLTLALMNVTNYEALARIPLGVATALSFVGPLGLAIAGSRRLLDLVWAGLAGAGILLLLGGIGGELDPLGVLLALLVGGLWASYILLSAGTGRAIPGAAGLAVATAVGAIALAPVGVAAGSALLHPGLLASMLAVALLSSVIPQSLELESLRRLSMRTFGVLMSLEPAVAALAGFAILGQALGLREAAGIALVVAASAGASRGSRRARTRRMSNQALDCYAELDPRATEELYGPCQSA